MSNATTASAPASFANLSAAATRAAQAARQLAELNVQATKTTLAELVEHARAVAAAKSPAELAKLQVASLQAMPQKALAYGRHVKEILATAAAGQRQAAEAQVADAQAQFIATVEDTLKNAPGSDNVLNLVKSAVASANNAYEGVNKTSDQVAAALEANVAQIAETVSSTAVASSAKTED